MSSVKYKWNAEEYAKNSSVQLIWAKELLSKLPLNGNESIVDIGCGDGKISAELALQVKNGKVLGIDQSKEMICHASTRFNPEAYPNLSFMRMDATNLKLPKAFDIAFSNATLHWIKDHCAVLRGIHSIVKTGGKILMQMGGYGNAADIIATIDMIASSPKWEACFRDFRSPYYFYNTKEYSHWLSKCGFKPVRIELMHKDMQQDGFNGLLSWLRTTWFPYTDTLPVNLRNTFLEEVTEAYIATNPIDAQGKIHVKMVRLEVEAIVV